MGYETFTSAVKKEVEQCSGRDMRVELHATIKNNGKEMIGIRFEEDGINISPVIYLEEYYKMWKNGKTIKDIASSIWSLYDEVKARHSWDVSEFHKYEFVKGRLACKLINYEKNQKLLHNTPHIKYLDFAIVFYLLVDSSKEGSSTMLVKDEHKEMWEVSPEEMYKDAICNMEQVLPSHFQTMNSVVKELLEDGIFLDGYEESEITQIEDRMYVLSNNTRNFGASCILYKKKLESIGNILKEDFYILPSSIHEVIIVPASKAPNREDMDEMVREINQTQVLEEEILSDHVYYFTRQTGMLLY